MRNMYPFSSIIIIYLAEHNQLHADYAECHGLAYFQLHQIGKPADKL